jgi:DNA-binding PadR family transcriptional regulator
MHDFRQTYSVNGVKAGDLHSNKNRESVSKTKVLQHFEHAVILAVHTLGPSAFPAEITRYLSKTLNRYVSLAQVFVALERMEDKGFVSSRDQAPEPVRGGRRRRIFQVEASGAQAIRDTAAAFTRMAPLGDQVETSDAGRQEGLPSPA